MPKEDIDYSNTVFYKIHCKDSMVTDLYVGHTTNFVQRKYAHKRACNTESDANYSLKVYRVIRENGGWDNWKMEIIGFNECDDHFEARKIEQKYFESLNANLNSIAPMPKRKLHGNQKMPVQISENNQNKSCYKCLHCNFETSKLSNYNLHLNTMKHKKNIANVKKPSFQCNICDKKFKTNSGLWKHRKNCKVNPESTEEDISNNQDELKEMICSLIERQNELKNQQEEQTRTISQILEKLETLSK